jgi:hypothetical protein
MSKRGKRTQKSIQNELNGLEQQFDMETKDCFQQLMAAETSTLNARLSVQRLFMIRESIARLLSGKRSSRASHSKIKSLFMVGLLWTFHAFAGTYPTLVNTNLAAAMGNAVQWRECLEPEIFTSVVTNWSKTLSLTDSTGVVKHYEVATLLTNRTIKFSFEGKTYVQFVDQHSGPEVGRREFSLPSPLSPQQLRNQR